MTVGDYPESVTIDGVRYTVDVDRDRDGEIEYFQLSDPNDEFFFEVDWGGPFTEEDVLSMVKNYE